MQSPPVKQALISVSDKMGLAGFAKGLAAAGVEIYSTGGTRKHLENEGIEVRDVADYTGVPEMMYAALPANNSKGLICQVRLLR